MPATSSRFAMSGPRRPLHSPCAAHAKPAAPPKSPAIARRIAEACRVRSVDMLDAPVSGRPPTMTVMAGGDPSVFAKYRPLLAAMAGNIFHVGEAGAGCVAKLVTQYLGYTNFVAALEGLLI